MLSAHRLPYFNLKLMREESAERQRVSHKLQLCPEEYLKALLRKFKARTLDALPNAIQNAFHSVTVSDCSGWFRFCGYAL